MPNGFGYPTGLSFVCGQNSRNFALTKMDNLRILIIASLLTSKSCRHGKRRNRRRGQHLQTFSPAFREPQPVPPNPPSPASGPGSATIQTKKHAACVNKKTLQLQLNSQAVTDLVFEKLSRLFQEFYQRIKPQHWHGELEGRHYAPLAWRPSFMAN